MNRKNLVEDETKMFWRYSRELREMAAAGLDLCDHLDDVDTIRTMTESETLKESCTALILRYAGRQNARRVTA